MRVGRRKFKTPQLLLPHPPVAAVTPLFYFIVKYKPLVYSNV